MLNYLIKVGTWATYFRCQSKLFEFWIKFKCLNLKSHFLPQMFNVLIQKEAWGPVITATNLPECFLQTCLPFWILFFISKMKNWEITKAPSSNNIHCVISNLLLYLISQQYLKNMAVLFSNDRRLTNSSFYGTNGEESNYIPGLSLLSS